jgi:hypothetical protein
VSAALPSLMDCAAIMRELGVKRATAEAIMRKIPKVDDPDIRKVFVKRADVLAWVEQNTRAA